MLVDFIPLTLLFLVSAGLKAGGVGSSGGPGSTYHYTFHGDPHATFASFFGGSNPFDMFFGPGRSRGTTNGFDHVGGEQDMDLDMDGDEDPFSAFGRFGNGVNGLHHGGGGRRHPAEPLHRRGKLQDAPVVHELRVSLEEIFHGCTKRMKITRRRLNPDGRTARSEDKILHIVIKRGWKEGTKITFPKEGDETPENIPADIAFVLKDKPHPHFKRDGSNIIYSATICLKEVCNASVQRDALCQQYFPGTVIPCCFMIEQFPDSANAQIMLAINCTTLFKGPSLIHCFQSFTICSCVLRIVKYLQ